MCIMNYLSITNKQGGFNSQQRVNNDILPDRRHIRKNSDEKGIISQGRYNKGDTLEKGFTS